MATKVRKLTPQALRKIVLDEARKIRLEVVETGKDRPEDVKTKEIDADEWADTLGDKVDHMKALGIKEARLRKELEKVQKQKKTLRARI